jgi:hypothetical protein
MVVSDSDDGGGRFGDRLEVGSDTQAGVMGPQAHRAEFINAEGSKCRDDFEGVELWGDFFSRRYAGLRAPC